MRIFHLACAITGLFLFTSFTPTNVLAQELRPEESVFFQSWSKRHRINGDHLSYALVDVATGEVKENHRGNSVHPLASVSKIFTAKYVLDTLGEEARFQTSLLSNGSQNGEVLKGQLALKGNGDPMLFITELTYLCEQLAAKGIRKFEGDFFYDDQFPYSKEEISSLGLGDQTYNSGISGLNVNFNRIEFYRQQNFWSSIPPIASFQLASSEKDFAPGVRFLYDPLTIEMEKWEFKNGRRYDQREELPMKRPGMHAAAFLQLQCRQYGIELPNPKAWRPTPYRAFKGNVLAEHRSLPVREIQRLALEYSNNIMAEASLLLAASHGRDLPITLREASENMVQWHKRTTPNLPWSEVILVNGSGISSENKSSSLVLAQWLAEVEKSPQQHRRLKTLLPLVGHSGWISARFKYPDVTHRMWAKTGTLDYVTNLAGYMVGKDQRLYAFALLYADQEKRQYLDTFNDDRADKWRRQAPAEKRKLSGKIDEILLHWLSKY